MPFLYGLHPSSDGQPNCNVMLSLYHKPTGNHEKKSSWYQPYQQALERNSPVCSVLVVLVLLKNVDFIRLHCLQYIMSFSCQFHASISVAPCGEVPWVLHSGALQHQPLDHGHHERTGQSCCWEPLHREWLEALCLLSWRHRLYTAWLFPKGMYMKLKKRRQVYKEQRRKTGHKGYENRKEQTGKRKEKNNSLALFRLIPSVATVASRSKEINV